MPPDNFLAYPDGSFDYLARVAIRFATTFDGKAPQELGSRSHPSVASNSALIKRQGSFVADVS
jgi:hypothetical protein